MADYALALDMALPTSYSFTSCDPLSIVVHETGGDMTLEAVHATFLATMRSTHFAIDQEGRVAQFVPLVRGAGGNCCPDRDASGNLLCDPYWYAYVQQYGNLNLCTISIEHCNNATNSLPMTQAQIDASNKLILWLCQRFNLNINHIKGHNSINPVNKPDCPGTFSFSQLATFLAGQERNPFMEQQFSDVWFSVAWAFKSGIYQKVLDAFRAHQVSACYPLGPEIKTVDWSGNSIQFQALSNGLHAEWRNDTGACALYDYGDRQIA